MMYLPPRSVDLSRADAMREASGLLRNAISNLLSLPGRLRSADATGGVFARGLYWTIDMAYRGNEAVHDFQEEFSYGYLELCRAAQTVSPPKFWGWGRFDIRLTSQHMAAATWLLNKLGQLRHAAGIDGWDPTLFDAAKGDVSAAGVEVFGALIKRRREEMLAWTEVVSGFPDDALAILALESVAALPAIKLLPKAKHGAGESYSDEADDSGSRYQPPPCTKCNGPTKVSWTRMSSSGSRTRKLVCQDENCGKSFKKVERS